MSRIRVSIGRVSLRGLDDEAGRFVADALRGELARMLAEPREQAHWTQSRQLPVLRLGRLPIQPGTSGGRQLGGAIARGIGKGAGGGNR